MEILEMIGDSVFGVFSAIKEIISSIPALWNDKVLD